MKIALWHVRRLHNYTGRVGEGLPGEAIQHPDQAQCPSNRGISAQALPVEEKIQADLLARYQSSEENKDPGACIVCELQEDNLGENADWREIGECTGSRGAASAWHESAGDALWHGHKEWRVPKSRRSVLYY